jgi:hypothetical protein
MGTRPSGGAPGESEWQALESEHRQLEQCAERVGMALGGLAEGHGEVRDTLVLLREFRTRLHDHLASEEGKRILERAARNAPRFLERVETLRGEHAELRRRVDALKDEAEGAREEDWPDVYGRFVELRRLLRAHEAAENDLVQRAYLEDIGGPG